MFSVVCLFGFSAFAAKAPEVVKASSFGFDATNATKCLQAAFDSRAKRVIIDRQDSPWHIDPVFLRSNQEVVLENGVVVEARRGGFLERNDTLFTLRNVGNVRICGEGKSVLRMHKADYQDASRYRPAEWRHGIGIFNSQDIAISNLCILSSGGDGLYVANGCRISMDALTVSDHHRQGLSLISGDDIKVRNCVFALTDGCPPGAGIDLEPNESREGLSNILVEDCSLYGNCGYGLDIHIDMLRNSASRPFSATFRRCKVYGNGDYGAKLSMGTTDPVKGTLMFENCTFSGNGKSALLFRNQYAGRTAVTFDRCVFDARGCEGAAVEIENNTLFEPFGGVSLRYVDLVADADQKKLSYSALPGSGVDDVIGNLDLIYGSAPRDIVPFVSFMGLPERDASLDVFRGRTVDREKLLPLNPSASAKSEGPWLRGNFTFLQHVSKAGEYPIAFRLGKVGPRNPFAYVTVRKCGSGKKIDGFSIRQENGFVYRFSAPEGGVYAFETMTFGHVAAVDSPFPGQGYDLSGGICPMERPNGRPQRYFFRVPAGAKDVSVQIVTAKGEPLEARLISPDGKVAARMSRRDGGYVLRAVRADISVAETWCYEIVNAVDDSFFTVGSPALPVAANDPALVFDAEALPDPQIGKDALAKQVEAAWDGVFKFNYEPKTSVLIEKPVEELPTPEMIAREEPNMCGWGTGMEDGLLSGGPMLLAALARWDASGGKDVKAEESARKIYKGLANCAEISGVPGFLARAIHPGDMKSFYPCSSRDQYTLFVYSFWRAYSHPLAEKNGWRPVIRRILADVAAYCRRTVTKENGWQLGRVDGKKPLVCKMWTDDVVGKPDGRGSVDFGDIYPHEMTRLPMIYLAAWSVTGDAQWKAEYEKYADDAIRMNECHDPASERAFALMQMQVANRLIYEIEDNSERKARLLKIMQDRAKWVALVSSPSVRMDDLFARKDKFYGREIGERMLVQSLCPGWKVSPSERKIFVKNVMRTDFADRLYFPPATMLWYYWAHERLGE